MRAETNIAFRSVALRSHFGAPDGNVIEPINDNFETTKQISTLTAWMLSNTEF